MQITNNYGLPSEIVSAMSKFQRVKPETFAGLSVTTILKPYYQNYLQWVNDDKITEDAMDRFWALFGTAIHVILESGSSTTAIKELSMKFPICFRDANGTNHLFHLTGILDYYDPATEILRDYKTTSTWTSIFWDQEKYSDQLNIYKWLLKSIGYEVKKIEVVLIMRDWNESKTMDPSYPQSFIEIKDIPIKTDQATEDLIYERFIKHCQAIVDGVTPDFCTDSEKWIKPGSYAIMKTGVKRAVKLHETLSAAELHLSEINDSKCYIEKRNDIFTRCDRYCNVNQFCDFYKSRANRKDE
jgi:hypothetical protein